MGTEINAIGLDNLPAALARALGSGEDGVNYERRGTDSIFSARANQAHGMKSAVRDPSCHIQFDPLCKVTGIFRVLVTREYQHYVVLINLACPDRARA